MVNYSPEERPNIVKICQILIIENNFDLNMFEKNNL